MNNTPYINEINQVRELGERIGYGNMMSIAAALWTIKLREDGTPRQPPRIATNLSSLKPEYREAAEADIESTVEFINQFASATSE